MKYALLICFSLLSILAYSNNYISQVWVADNGDGTYKNPILYADYSDPDVCRVGEDFFMTASSFNCIPGLPILHSKDLVNWKIVNHALVKQPPYEIYNTPQHGCGVWAPSIRFHEGNFYIFYGDPDYGIYMVKTADPFSQWDEPVLVKKGWGLIDPCPLWDDDGKAYLVHALAGSRASMKSLIVVQEMDPSGTKMIGKERIVFDGHDDNETIEGPKFYKRDGYYYIFAPAGGVKTGWQLAMRSKEIYGPYDYRIVLAQGNTGINGPHQGAWITTATGEDWFIHFQDAGPYGRITHLQPMYWKDEWPYIGTNHDADGCGEPVLSWKKPDIGKNYPITTPRESDEFNSRELGLQWQWHANSEIHWAYPAGEKGILRLFSVVPPKEYIYGNLLDHPNLLLQKFPAEEFTVETKLTFIPSGQFIGEKAGLIIMGWNYGMIALDNTAEGILLSQVECYGADKKNKEVINETAGIVSNTIWLRVNVYKGAKCNFFYSTDGKIFRPVGKEFTAREGRWIGAKTGLFINRPRISSDGGWIDVEYFNIEPLK